MAESDPIKLILIEDDDGFRESAHHWLSRKGHSVAEAPNGQVALRLAEQSCFDVAVVDMNMPGISGLEVIQRMHEICPETEYIVLTGQASVENAVEAMKLGACDYLTKPFPLADLERRCLMAAERGQLQKENQQLRDLLNWKRPKTKIIGDSTAIKQVFRMIDRVAPTDKVVLVQGESGTGKELVARAIQERSPRAERPFVTINCAALPETLVESELFGHEKGAFTGATQRKSGLFEVANGGTLFIDEIGELPLALQPKLLRVLEDGSLRRVGSLQERRVDVRIIAATNRDLQQEVSQGTFREDLYYRINVMTLMLPPLRERKGDVALLTRHFLKKKWDLSEEAQLALQKYHWPGNVRQLFNALDRAMIMADGENITKDDLPQEVLGNNDDGRPLTVHSGDLAEIEKQHIIDVLNQKNGNKAQAAKTLGIHRRKLYRLIERYGIEVSK